MKAKKETESAKAHALTEVWETRPEIFGSPGLEPKVASLETLFGDFFAVGDYYYYILDTSTGKIFHQNSTLLEHHEFETLPTEINQIIELVHPDDLPFVLKAEKACYDKISEIGTEHLKELKSSYNFRMRRSSGDYHLYHHQAIHLHLSPQGLIHKAANIHTNIEHITKINRYTALVSGIGTRKDYHQIQVLHSDEPFIRTCLTRREIEVLRLIAVGASTEQIASKLYISIYTVSTHRKNILAKAKCKNSSELIKKALEQGVI